MKKLYSPNIYFPPEGRMRVFIAYGAITKALHLPAVYITTLLAIQAKENSKLWKQ